MKIPPASPSTPEPLANDPWQWPDAEKDVAEPDYAFIDRLIALGSDSPESPFFQYFAVLKCRQLRPEIEAGDGFSTLAAVRICGSSGLKMPLWLVHAFNRKYDAVLNFRAISWDAPESFGKPYPKGTNMASKRKRRVLSSAVHNAVTLEKQMTGAAIDKELFEKVGAPLGLGVTLTEDYYRHAKKMRLRNSDTASIPADFQKAAGIKNRSK
jgi:hypothetical protein